MTIICHVLVIVFLFFVNTSHYKMVLCRVILQAKSPKKPVFKRKNLYITILNCGVCIPLDLH